MIRAYRILFVLILLGILCLSCQADECSPTEGYFSIDQISRTVTFLSEYWGVEQNEVMAFLLDPSQKNINGIIEESVYYLDNQEWPDLEWYTSRYTEEKNYIVQRPEGLDEWDSERFPVFGGENWAAYSINGCQYLSIARVQRTGELGVVLCAKKLSALKKGEDEKESGDANPEILAQPTSTEEDSCCDDSTLSAGFRKNICGCPVSDEEYAEYQKNPTG